ncbi:MAG: hypothetical protein IJI68_01270 [Eggerthellaceae bacterium]|nr:hypothetical protein [Eggerthellaceae bacterium]
MKQKIGIILVACLSFALCMALSACVLTNKSLYVGTWELQDSNGDTFDSDTMELMKTLDVKVTLSLVDDGTGTLNYLGTDPHSVTWKASSNTEGELSVDGETNKLSLNEAVLTMTDDEGTYMTFAKVSDEPVAASAAVASSKSAPEGSASSESASSEAAESTEKQQDGAAEEQQGENGEETEATADGETVNDEAGEWNEGAADVGDSAYEDEGQEETA